MQYETIYFVPKNGATDIGRTLSYEWREMPAGGDPYYEKIVLYYPAGRWMALQRGLGITRIIEGGQTAQNWSLSGNFPSAWISQGMTFYANPNPGISTFTYGQFVPAYDVSWGDINGIMMGEKIDGLLGVLPGQSLWTSGPQSKASMIMMGTHGGYAGHQLLYSSGASIYGTGAFFADVLGVIRETGGASGNPIDGLLIGLYADGQGKVGALKGEWTGYSYPKIGMWETAVSDTAAYIYRDGTLKDIAGGAVNAGNLTDHLISSGIGLGTNGTFYGTFGGSGYISTPVGVTGRTYFLDDQPDWGIFRLMVGAMNYYEKPSGTGTSFSATLFGDGGFGRYKENSYHDLGMWYANLSSGTWENEKLAGAFTGEFVTLLKKGTIEGKLLGTYEGKGSWQAVGAGTWAKAQDVYFGSEIWGKNYTLT
ncbi:MAG: hypothetical protein N2509_08455, partial [Treponemataceae bacterium]|nr:hypothetical protein [Treponemataceae bacterium]